MQNLKTQELKKIEKMEKLKNQEYKQKIRNQIIKKTKDSDFGLSI